MTPEIGFNGKRFKLELKDIIQILILVAALAGSWFGTKAEVASVKAWGDPPAGRLYVLEADVARHHNVTEATQQAKIDMDHDKVIAIERDLQTLTKELEKNNRLLERLLNRK